MKVSVTAEGLLAAIERRLTEISQQQHALAVERAYLQEQTTPLRLGILSPAAALLNLKVHGLSVGGVSLHSTAPRQGRREALLPRG
jgi:hypothetical protein